MNEESIVNVDLDELDGKWEKTMRRNKSFTTTPFYLIATPIGNLKEITPRLIETLNEVDFVACEDTRVAAKLLNHLNIKKHLISLFKHDEIEKSNLVLFYLRKEKGAYLSDAGYPLISDPGSYLVNLLIENDIYISVINGPSAFTCFSRKRTSH